MRTQHILGLSLTMISVTGCFGGDGGDWNLFGSSPTPVVPEAPPPRRCRPPDATFEPMRVAHEDVRRSANTMINGHLQLVVARNLLLLALDANRQHIEPSTYSDLTLALRFRAGLLFPDVIIPEDEAPSQDEAGQWTLLLPYGPNATLRFAFRDPDTGGAVLENVFALDSYVQGATVESQRTTAPDGDDASAPYDVTVTWDEPGPLVRLLGGAEVIPRPFVLRGLNPSYWTSSENAQLDLGDASFGPLEPLFDLPFELEPSIETEENETVIQHTLAPVRSTLREFVSAHLPFELQKTTARAGDVTIEGGAVNVVFSEADDRLDGTLDYEVAYDGTVLYVQDVYGREGLTTRWTCQRSDGQ